jgi:hypothetical protein
MFDIFKESPLVALYRIEYHSDYIRMKKQGYNLTERDVKCILGYPDEPTEKKFFGLF